MFAVPFNIDPDDYTAISSQPVTFSSGPDQICIPISISNDGVVEETESFTVTLVSGDPAVQVTLPNANVTIADSTGKYLFVNEANDDCMDSMIVFVVSKCFSMTCFSVKT